MHHIVMTSCRVQPEKMKEFFGHIQQWEHAVEKVEYPPEYHTLYVSDADPSQAVSYTHLRAHET